MYFSFVKLQLLITLSFLIGLSSCSDNRKEPTLRTTSETPQEIPAPNIVDTNLIYSFAGKPYEVAVMKPKVPFKGTILVLQGWNFPNSSWCDSSDLCEKALKEGYFLVLPEMKKSIYHLESYRETRKDWLQYPTRAWLMDEVLADLNSKFDLFDSRHNNYVLGLSTGGRGALILAEENSDVFVAGASLSGDYDQSEFPKDLLYIGYFGRNPENWSPKENPVATIKEWKVPMYIGHGTSDAIVPVAHYHRLKALTDSVRPDLDFEFSLKENQGHDYRYWASEVNQMLHFFRKHRR